MRHFLFLAISKVILVFVEYVAVSYKKKKKKEKNVWLLVSIPLTLCREFISSPLSVFHYKMDIIMLFCLWYRFLVKIKWIMQKEIICNLKFSVIIRTFSVHVTFTAQLMHSFRIKKMLNNLLRICPVKSKIWEKTITSTPQIHLAERELGKRIVKRIVCRITWHFQKYTFYNAEI